MGRLDDPAMYAADPGGMVAHAERLGSEFLHAWKTLPPPEGCGQVEGPVAIAGMGGSGAAASYAATLVNRDAGTVCFHVEGPRLPPVISAGGLLVACSYSGNTPEILACTRESLVRRTPVIVVTAGGELRNLAERERLPIVRIAYESVPRAALGHLLAGVLRAVVATGAISMDSATVDAAAASHREYVDRVAGRDVPQVSNAAKQFAAKHRGGPALIAAADHLVPAARRMANQLAENAKCLAVAATIPEMQHNLVETFFDPVHRPASMVVFDSPLAHDLERRSAAHVAAIARDRDVAVHCIELAGTSMLADLMAATAYGDLASCYLALSRGIDPTPIPVIDAIKARYATDTDAVPV